jgi:DNA-binding CsgD family transcriptional regulator
VTEGRIEPPTPGNVPKVPGHLLGLLEESNKLMNEVQTVLRRIGVELGRLGISPSTLPVSCRPPACPELDSLSPRESEVVKLLTEGHRVSTIARSLFISQHTVRNHLQSVYRKVGVSSQSELIEKLKGSARPSPAPTELRHCG